jgi:hypothetical protein
MKKLFPLSLLLLAGCPGFKYDAPRPPTWDDECKASEPYYMDMARGTQFLAEEGDIPSDPEEALAAAHKYLADRDVDIEYKADGIEDWSKFNTTFPKTVYVTKNFDDRQIEIQVVILWHEIVHLREYEQMSPKTFYEHYLFAEGRWALEVQAYREGFRVMRLLGLSESRIRSQMSDQAESLYVGYELGQVGENGPGIPKQCAVGGAVDIWLTDAP